MPVIQKAGETKPPTPTLPRKGRGVGVVPPCNPGLVEEMKTKAKLLSKQERKELADYLHYLALPTNRNTAAPDTATRAEVLWGDAVAEELFKLVGGGPKTFPPTAALVTLRRQVWAGIDSFIRDAGIPAHSSIEKISAYRVLARLLVLHAQGTADHVGAPLTVKFVLERASNMAAVFDAAFPGYLGSGMAARVFPVLSR